MCGNKLENIKEMNSNFLKKFFDHLIHFGQNEQMLTSAGKKFKQQPSPS